MTLLQRNLLLSLGTAAALGCGAAWADPVATAADCGSITSVQRHIVERADQDMTALHDYVRMTTLIHGIGMAEVADSLDGWRAIARCRDEAAVAAAKASTRAQAAKADVDADAPQRTAGR